MDNEVPHEQKWSAPQGAARAAESLLRAEALWRAQGQAMAEAERRLEALRDLAQSVKENDFNCSAPQGFRVAREPSEQNEQVVPQRWINANLTRGETQLRVRCAFPELAYRESFDQGGEGAAREFLAQRIFMACVREISARSGHATSGSVVEPHEVPLETACAQSPEPWMREVAPALAQSRMNEEKAMVCAHQAQRAIGALSEAGAPPITGGSLLAPTLRMRGEPLFLDHGEASSARLVVSVYSNAVGRWDAQRVDAGPLSWPTAKLMRSAVQAIIERQFDASNELRGSQPVDSEALSARLAVAQALVLGEQTQMPATAIKRAPKSL